MRRIPLMFIALVAVIAFVAAACSSDSEEETTTTQAPTTTQATTTTTASEAAPEQSIAEIVSTAEGFSTLLAAVQAAGLAETLNTDGPFTVFAPTDEAFAALPTGTVESLLEDTEALTNVLLYHVVDGAVAAEDVVNLDSVTTLQGSDIKISVDNGVFFNEESMAIATNILASNGIIHAIDAVLLP